MKLLVLLIVMLIQCGCGGNGASARPADSEQLRLREEIREVLEIIPEYILGRASYMMETALGIEDPEEAISWLRSAKEDLDAYKKKFVTFRDLLENPDLTSEELERLQSRVKLLDLELREPHVDWGPDYDIGRGKK